MTAAPRIINIADVPYPHAKLAAFVEANGLDPHQVPYESVLTVTEGSLTAEVFQTDENGRRVHQHNDDPADPRPRYARETKTVPLLHDPEEFGL